MHSYVNLYEQQKSFSMQYLPKSNCGLWVYAILDDETV